MRSFGNRLPLLLVLFIVAFVGLPQPAASYLQACKKNFRAAYEQCNASRGKRDIPALLISRVFQSGSRSDLHSTGWMTESQPRRKRQMMRIKEIIVSSGTSSESLAEESGSDAGFRISFDEMIELIDDIYERTSRSSRKTLDDNAKQEIFNTITQCCKNSEMCIVSC